MANDYEEITFHLVSAINRLKNEERELLQNMVREKDSDDDDHELAEALRKAFNPNWYR